MPLHRQTLRVPYSAEQMFDLVVDIEQYPLFVPGYCEARVLVRDGQRLRAYQRVGFGVLSASFESEADFERPCRIRVRSYERPFHLLEIEWHFEPDGSGCLVNFRAEFHLAESLAAHAVSPWFKALNEQLTGAFVRRARALYG
jgi:coenzyme Q-binding protein COQ10